MLFLALSNVVLEKIWHGDHLEDEHLLTQHRDMNQMDLPAPFVSKLL